MNDEKPPKPRDYILIILNILIVLLFVVSVGLSVSGYPQATLVMGGPIGALVLIAGMRRRKRRKKW